MNSSVEPDQVDGFVDNRPEFNQYTGLKPDKGTCPGRTESPNRMVVNDNNNCNGIRKSQIAKIGMELAQYIIDGMTTGKSLKHPNIYAATLHRTVQEISNRHKLVFNNVTKKLEISHDNIEEKFTQVADEMISNSALHWGRIPTIYAFGGHIAKHCASSNMQDSVSVVIKVLGEFVANRFGKWIEQQGGWDAFNERFPDGNDSMESSIWKGLFFTAVGLGALATMVAAR